MSKRPTPSAPSSSLILMRSPKRIEGTHTRLEEQRRVTLVEATLEPELIREARPTMAAGLNKMQRPSEVDEATWIHCYLDDLSD